MKRRQVFTALLVLLVVIALTFFAGRLIQEEDTRLPVQTQIITPSDLEKSISVIGVVIPLQEHLIRAPLSEVITEIFVSEGEEIVEDQILLILEERELRMNLKENQLQLLQAQRDYQELIDSKGSQEEEESLRIRRETTNIERAEEALERLKNDAEQETLRYERQVFSLERESSRVSADLQEMESLYQLEAISQKDLQQVENRLTDLEQELVDVNEERDLYLEVILPQQLRSANLDLRQAKESLEEVMFSLQQARITDEDIQVQKARVEQLQERVNSIQQDLEKTHLYAGGEGQVISLFVAEGDLVTRSQPLMQIFTGGEYGVEVSLDEMDMGAIRRGQMVKITSAAYPGEMAIGHMDWIAPRARQQGNIALFDVQIMVVDGSDFLRLGMFVDLEIITDSGEGIFVLPVQALRRSPGYTAVFVVEDGLAKKKEVITGIETLSRVEIREGLEEGDEIITGSFSVLQRMEDGMEVLVLERGSQDAH